MGLLKLMNVVFVKVTELKMELAIVTEILMMHVEHVVDLLQI